MENDFTELFGAYDIRGVVGKNLHGPIVRKIAHAYGDVLCPNRLGRFLIGHDGRLSSPALAESFSVGLREAGHQVVLLGEATTSMIYWCGAEGLYDGSVCVTASHLPAEHNGFKLCREDAIPLSGEHGLPEIIAKMKQQSLSSRFSSVEYVQRVNLLSYYAATLRSYLKPKRMLKVAVDAGNGVGGLDTELLFNTSDYVRLWKIGFHPDGMFPGRGPNPLEPHALNSLSKIVVDKGCDFGLAYDGDADRAVVVDEKGKQVPPDMLGLLIALFLLKEKPGSTILYDLRATRAFPEAIRKAGGNPIRTRVGHAFVKAAMRQHKAVFAAELSGHYYFSDLHYTDSGLRTLIELCNLVSEQKRPFSELLVPFQTYVTSGEINLHVADANRILTSLKDTYKEGKIDLLDGLSVDYADWWFNVRASHTEPLIRVNVGATNAQLLQEKKQALLNQIEETKSKGTI